MRGICHQNSPGAVHVRVRIGADDQRPRHRVAVIDDDLVANSGAGGIEVDALIAREDFDLSILLQVRLRAILNVVIECEDRLSRIVAGLEHVVAALARIDG